MAAASSAVSGLGPGFAGGFPSGGAPSLRLFQRPGGTVRRQPVSRRFEAPAHTTVRPTPETRPRPAASPRRSAAVDSCGASTRRPARSRTAPNGLVAPGAARSRRSGRAQRRVSATTNRATTLRLTRRGQILCLLLVAVAVYGAFGLGRASAGGKPAGGVARHVIVQPGESLWTVAVRAMPHSDPRDVVGQLESINHLADGQVAAGQQLQLP